MTQPFLSQQNLILQLHIESSVSLEWNSFQMITSNALQVYSNHLHQLIIVTLISSSAVVNIVREVSRMQCNSRISWAYQIHFSSLFQSETIPGILCSPNTFHSLWDYGISWVQPLFESLNMYTVIQAKKVRNVWQDNYKYDTGLEKSSEHILCCTLLTGEFLFPSLLKDLPLLFDQLLHLRIQFKKTIEIFLCLNNFFYRTIDSFREKEKCNVTSFSFHRPILAFALLKSPFSLSSSLFRTCNHIVYLFLVLSKPFVISCYLFLTSEAVSSASKKSLRLR